MRPGHAQRMWRVRRRQRGRGRGASVALRNGEVSWFWCCLAASGWVTYRFYAWVGSDQTVYAIIPQAPGGQIPTDRRIQGDHNLLQANISYFRRNQASYKHVTLHLVARQPAHVFDCLCCLVSRQFMPPSLYSNSGKAVSFPALSPAKVSQTCTKRTRTASARIICALCSSPSCYTFSSSFALPAGRCMATWWGLATVGSTWWREIPCDRLERPNPRQRRARLSCLRRPGN